MNDAAMGEQAQAAGRRLHTIAKDKRANEMPHNIQAVCSSGLDKSPEHAARRD
jgi:hypothetical protein